MIGCGAIAHAAIALQAIAAGKAAYGEATRPLAAHGVDRPQGATGTGLAFRLEVEPA
jgi:hypothetical protein